LSVPGFEFPRDIPRSVHFVGTPPIIPNQVPPPPSAHELDGSRKVVLVTQGTVANHNFELLIAPTLAALANEPVLVVARADGRPVEAIPCAVPPNARVASCLPFEWLLPRDRRRGDEDRLGAPGADEPRIGGAHDRRRAGSGGRSAGSGPLSAISLARRSIRGATPFFLPDEQLITALQLAVLRGVDLHLVLPSHNNHRPVTWAAQTHMRPLLQSGCHLWRSAAPFDHSKLVTIDRSWSLIGSANWDMRSRRPNFELTVEFYDTDLAGKLAGMIDARCASRLHWRKSTSARCQ
jgi:phosphatidylserine/phosphatidylglycerophosphate/cardiolipin synthase-like enzyme